MSELITYYLEMRAFPESLSDNNESPSPQPYMLQECLVDQPQLNAFLYRLVGASWQWTERLDWTDDQWQELVSSPNLRTWVAYSQGIVAGYFELRKQASDVEILYFGLSPQCLGKGLGRALLEDAIRRAWAWDGVSRVWLHTCNLDHPAALANYQRRGFTLYKTDKTEQTASHS